MKRIVAIAKIVYGRRIKKVYEFSFNVSKHTVVVEIYDNQIPFSFTRWTFCGVSDNDFNFVHDSDDDLVRSFYSIIGQLDRPEVHTLKSPKYFKQDGRPTPRFYDVRHDLW